MMTGAMKEKKIGFGLILIVVCCLLSASGCARFSKQKPGEKPDLSQPRQSFYSAPLERLNSGFINILSGPFELADQMREEIKRTNPLSALIPGLAKGITWCVTREVVGVFEVATFYLPLKPHLKPVNTDWLTL